MGIRCCGAEAGGHSGDGAGGHWGQEVEIGYLAIRIGGYKEKKTGEHCEDEAGGH